MTAIPPSPPGPGDRAPAEPAPPPVLVQKLRRPEVNALDRPRLVRSLLGSTARVGLVVAPAGVGKTTLLAQCASACEHPAAWYTVGQEDLSEAALVAHLAATTATAGDAPLLPHTRMEDLLVDLQARSDPLLLVVDDVHEIAGTQAEAALERLVRLCPPPLRLLIGSRRLPALNLARLTAAGTVVSLGQDDLRFRTWEVEQLYRGHYREPMSPEAVARLTRRTGGWAAGLQLFHLTIQGKLQAEREYAVSRLSGRSRLIRSYLTENLVDELPPQRRDFLIRTATLGVLRGDLCDDLLGTDGSGAVLADLERCQFFTTSVDDGSTYRYHQVLASHLEVLLVDTLGEQQARTLYGRSAELLERAGILAASVRAYARADRWPDVARVLRATESDLAWQDGDLHPRNIPILARDAWVRLSEARRLLREGEIGAAVEVFAEAEALAEDPTLVQSCRRGRSVATIWLPDGDGTARDGGPAAVLRRALRRVPAADSCVDQPPLIATLLHLLAGRVSPARTALDSSAVTWDLGWESLGVRLLRAVLDLLGDTPTTPLEQFDEIAADAEAGGYGWIARLATGVQAALADCEHADPAAEVTLRVPSGEPDPWGTALLGLLVADRLAHHGEADRAAGCLAAARAAATGLAAPVLLAWADGIEFAGRRCDVGAWPGAANARRLGMDGCLPVLARIATGTGQARVADATDPHRQITLQCLGGFRLDLDDAAVDLSSLRPKCRTLLQVLGAHHGQFVHRETLIDAVWPGVPLEVGTHRLHVATSSIRRRLADSGCGTRPVQRTGDTYRLQVDCCDLDRLAGKLAAWQQDSRTGDPLSRIGAGMAVLAAYPGDLLPEVGAAEWVVAERDRLRFQVSTVALETARAAQVVHRVPDGVRAAQRCVAIDPLRDTAWKLLAELQLTQGDHAAAQVTLREYERVSAVLS